MAEAVVCALEVVDVDDKERIRARRHHAQRLAHVLGDCDLVVQAGHRVALHPIEHVGLLPLFRVDVLPVGHQVDGAVLIPVQDARNDARPAVMRAVQRDEHVIAQGARAAFVGGDDALGGKHLHPALAEVGLHMPLGDDAQNLAVGQAGTDGKPADVLCRALVCRAVVGDVHIEDALKQLLCRALDQTAVCVRRLLGQSEDAPVVVTQRHHDHAEHADHDRQHQCDAAEHALPQHRNGGRGVLLHDEIPRKPGNIARADVAAPMRALSPKEFAARLRAHQLFRALCDILHLGQAGVRRDGVIGRNLHLAVVRNEKRAHIKALFVACQQRLYGVHAHADANHTEPLAVRTAQAAGDEHRLGIRGVWVMRNIDALRRLRGQKRIVPRVFRICEIERLDRAVIRIVSVMSRRDDKNRGVAKARIVALQIVLHGLREGGIVAAVALLLHEVAQQRALRHRLRHRDRTRDGGIDLVVDALACQGGDLFYMLGVGLQIDAIQCRNYRAEADEDDHAHQCISTQLNFLSHRLSSPFAPPQSGFIVPAARTAYAGEQ